MTKPRIFGISCKSAKILSFCPIIHAGSGPELQTMCGCPGPSLAGGAATWRRKKDDAAILQVAGVELTEKNKYDHESTFIRDERRRISFKAQSD